MGDFHFLRPWWLLAVPFGVALIVRLFRMQARGGGWRRIVDRPLQPLVLSEAGTQAGHRWPLAAALAAWVLASVAMAGPAWERLPVPAFRSDEALVVVLDMSRSMDAADLEPSRLARAKLKLLSLLESRTSGQTGLVVFSSHAFTVTPLTTDNRTVAALVSALSTDIMPSQGTVIEAGLEKAASLLRQANVREGRMLLISDGAASPDAISLASDLRDDGYELNVLGVGTQDGAPIPQQDGGFLTDGRGNVVVPRLDPRSLARLAEAGGGRFSPLTANDSDLERLLPVQQAGGVSAGADDDERVAEIWRDAGPWLALLLLPLLATGFRRGWVAVWLCALLIVPPGVGAQPPASAADGGASAASDERGGSWWGERWQSLWSRPDQRGAAAMDEERHARAAELFDDRQWRAAASYRAGDYADSAAALEGLDSASAHYNRGNALARDGRVEQAIAAYERALELEPDHDDARHNRDLLEELLDENQPEQQASSGEPEQQDPESPQDGEQGERSGDEQQADDAQSGEPQQRRAQSPQDGGSSQGEPSDGADEEPAEQTADAEAGSEGSDAPGEAEAEPEPREGRQAEADAQADAAGEDDVEQWASDQAAEQWLRRIEQDPGGLLRRKFLYQYQRRDQDGNPVWQGEETRPW